MNNLSLKVHRPSQQGQREGRARLLSAALDVFSRNGIEGATVADICRAAGYSKGGFYFHFRTKDDVVTELIGTGRRGTGADGFDRWPPGLLADLLTMASRKKAVRAPMARRYSARVDAFERTAASSSCQDRDHRVLAEIEALLETGLQLQSRLLSHRGEHVEARAFLSGLPGLSSRPVTLQHSFRPALFKGSARIRR